MLSQRETTITTTETVVTTTKRELSVEESVARKKLKDLASLVAASKSCRSETLCPCPLLLYALEAHGQGTPGYKRCGRPSLLCGRYHNHKPYTLYPKPSSHHRLYPYIVYIKLFQIFNLITSDVSNTSP